MRNLVKGGEEASKSANVFGKLSRTFRDIIVPSIRHPPWISLQIIGYRLMQGDSMGNIHFLVQTTVDHHNRTFDLVNSINIGVNI
jgi:hypothetical protein